MSSTIYELKYSGQDVEQAIDKINDFDPTTISGGIIELESSEASPYNLDFLRTSGIFKAAFVYALTCPSGVENCSPVFIYVSKVRDGSVNGKLIQSLYAGDVVFNRSSADLGINWTNWESKDGLDKAVEISPSEIDAIWESIMHGVNVINGVSLFSKAGQRSEDRTAEPTVKRVSC